jgi:uncharacterized membrane protein YdjX (TVP38/TMEM64 family)
MLLVADVLLPLPASIIMSANGALFGITAGTAVSLLGRMAGFAFGYWLGARALPIARRFVPDEELNRARAVLERHGWTAIIVSRPIPIVSETTAIMAGLAHLPLGKALIAALAGSVPEAAVLAAAGYYTTNFINPVFVFVGVVLVAAFSWPLFQKRS